MITGIYYDLFTHVFRIAGVPKQAAIVYTEKEPHSDHAAGFFFSKMGLAVINIFNQFMY